MMPVTLISDMSLGGRASNRLGPNHVTHHVLPIVPMVEAFMQTRAGSPVQRRIPTGAEFAVTVPRRDVDGDEQDRCAGG
jgi:hypothetical protein